MRRPGGEHVTLANLLSARKEAVIEEWFRKIAGTYAPDAALFLKAEKDSFANPVGAAFRRGLVGLYEGFLDNAEAKELAPFLDEIVRIRAVQDLSPSEAVSFVYFLKDLVRKVAADEQWKGGNAELTAMEDRIDRLALQAFDNYMACRETLFDIKVRELREKVAIHTGFRRDRAARSGNERTHKLQEGTNDEAR
jgi:hypothetical protein